jgi:hypothetical protein
MNLITEQIALKYDLQPASSNHLWILAEGLSANTPAGLKETHLFSSYQRRSV